MTPQQRELLIDLAENGLLRGEQSMAIRAALMRIDVLERELADERRLRGRLARRFDQTEHERNDLRESIAAISIDLPGQQQLFGEDDK